MNYLLPAFSFQVVVNGVVEDNTFQEVSGLEINLETETIKDGGESNFQHRLPKGIKHANLVLKRGVIKENSSLLTWAEQVLEGGFEQRIETADIAVNLLDNDGKPVASWSVIQAYPVTWSIGSLDTANSAVEIEKMEFAYSSFNRIR